MNASISACHASLSLPSGAKYVFSVGHAIWWNNKDLAVSGFGGCCKKSRFARVAAPSMGVVRGTEEDGAASASGKKAF